MVLTDRFFKIYNLTESEKLTVAVNYIYLSAHKDKEFNQRRCGSILETNKKERLRDSRLVYEGIESKQVMI